MDLKQLQQSLKEQKIDACIITRNNQFIGQDILPEENRIAQLCGFDGSAGKMIIFQDKALLFTDGRYALQAPLQTQGTGVEVIITKGESLGSWMQKNLNDKQQRIAYNPWCHTISETDYWKRTLRNLTFIENEELLVAPLYNINQCDIFEHDIEYAGISMDEKISQFTKFMQDNHLDGFIITACDSVSWLLNLRSDCLPDCPIIRAFAFINSNGEVSLFTNDFRKLESELQNYKNKNIGMDCKHSPSAIFRIMKKHKIWIENILDPIQNWKAIKNPVELSNIQKAHLKDARAVTRFLIWLEQNYSGQTELDIINKLNEYRQQEQNYFANSFATIAGFAQNGAIVHYHPTKTTNLTLHSGSLLLLDSGAQYFDGTTDITRTIAIGTPTPEMIHNYTIVLKSHIALASCYFPEGTNGAALDAITRAPLWKHGKDYAHGTGHGVGYFLNVHEGPCSISSRNGNISLAEHMITSIEPGYYKENHYGIRIENLAQVIRIEDNNFEQSTLGFEPLTLVPLDKRLIDKYLLNKDELAWLNNYHQTIFNKLSPLMNEQEKIWLEQACTPIEI